MGLGCLFMELTSSVCAFLYAENAQIFMKNRKNTKTQILLTAPFSL